MSSTQTMSSVAIPDPAPAVEVQGAVSSRASTPGLTQLIWVALSLSIGWGIRGNFGHEYGAMIPGALATLAAVLLCGRSDWHRRAAFFAFFGALGWSLGGSISYMQVIGYTHSGHSASVLYGFGCLFVIGFLWAAIGGAGAALPAFLDRERLTDFFPPLTAVFIGWTLQDFAVPAWFPEDPAYRQQSPLYWYDTDWLAALVAIVAVLVLAVIRRRVGFASSLILHMAIGWWVGFLVLVVLLGLRMTPPRGDNWAGCVGMTVGMWTFFRHQRLPGINAVSLLTGLIGGFGFAFADMLKLAGIATGGQTNWHSLLEQTYGLINGIGLGIGLFWAARHAPTANEEPRVRRWTESYAVVFVLLVITYVNLCKNPEEWVKTRAMPGLLYGFSADTWFNLAYMALAVLFIALLMAHRRRPLPFLSTSWLGKGQLLYLVFLWVMVIGNFERALVSFVPQRLVTEGVIFLNAVLCTGGLFLSASPVTESMARVTYGWGRSIQRVVWVGLIAAALSIVAEWAVVRAIYGGQQAGGAARHIRFGPQSNATKEKPKAGVPHP